MLPLIFGRGAESSKNSDFAQKNRQMQGTPSHFRVFGRVVPKVIELSLQIQFVPEIS